MPSPNLYGSPEPDAGRDAIHIAVYPAVAGEALCPGDPVAITNGVARASSEAFVAVVSPFLPGAVEEGDRVWVLMRPGTISDLRHVWSHPMCDDDAEESFYDDCDAC